MVSNYSWMPDYKSQFLIGKVLQVERIASGNVENTFVSQFLIGKVELSNHY